MTKYVLAKKSKLPKSIVKTPQNFKDLQHKIFDILLWV